MHLPAFVAILLALDFALLASAGVYFIQPASGSTCTGGSPCTISWLDDGNSPLLPTIGVVTAGLYTGEQQLVQTLEPVDVSNVLSAQFTPNPKAGPNSGDYYIAFTSTTAKQNGTDYIGFSPFFTLKGMSGSFSSPLASATKTIAIPTTITDNGGSILPTTITVGSVDTFTQSATRSPASSTTHKASSSFSSSSSSSSFTSRFATSSIPSPSSSASVTPASAASTSNAAPVWLPSRPILAILSFCAFWLMK